MTVDCQWISRNLEQFFCDQLSVEEHRVARTHIDNCAKCQQEIEGFTSIDPLIKQLFRHELAVARTPKRKSYAVAFGTAGAAALAALLLLVVFLRVPPEPTSVATVSHPATSAPSEPTTEAPAIKDNAAAEFDRSKPQPPSPDGRGSRTVGSAERDELKSARGEGISPDAPQFRVVDAAGYSRTLADYRGRVLILGIWSSDQSNTASNFEHVYRTFSGNTNLRILGVSSERNAKPANTTFPIAYNQGSRLLDTKVGDVLVIDSEGTIRHRASLLTNSNDLVKTVRTALEPLGIR